jgi:hypothetical protein
MFPLQSSIARWELIKGALILCIPIIGWILNMGHRIAMTHRMQHGLPAWPAWRDYPALFRHGLITLLGMIEYHLPAIVCEVLAWRMQSTLLHLIGAVLCCGLSRPLLYRGTCRTIVEPWMLGKCSTRCARFVVFSKVGGRTGTPGQLR